MMTIDGSTKSGSGTILRLALILSSILQRPIRITNIRAKRSKPGLRPQHLCSCLACKDITGGSLEGAEVGSAELYYVPGGKIRSGEFKWDIGTAGSTTMLFMTVLPILIFARKPSLISISGGLFQDFAPSAFHMKHVLFPLLKRMGINAEMDIIRPGYVPTGGGIIKGRIEPITQSIQPLQLLNQGRITEIRGIALSSHLKAQKVSERMANSCNRTLKKDSLCAEFEIINDEMALQKGATLFIETRTDTECILGADMAGKIGRTSEVIGQEVAYHLLSDLRSGATVDRYLADQLIVYAALAAGITEYLIPTPTEHVKTNLWLIEEILGTETSLIKNHVTIKGVGIDPKKHR